ncbi:MAG: DUF2306 domain-containing protein [Chitinophagales bacterium]
MLKQREINNMLWKAAFYSHVFSSIFLIPAGLTQFNSLLRERYPRLHRVVGLSYLVILLCISGPSGLYMAFFALGGWPAKLGFIFLAILWIAVTVKAGSTALDGNWRVHGQWMIVSYSLTLAAITLRSYKYFFLLTYDYLGLNLSLMEFYQINAWLSWIPNAFVGFYIASRL